MPLIDDIESGARVLSDEEIEDLWGALVANFFEEEANDID